MHHNLMSVDDLAGKLNVPKSWIYARTRETGPGSMPRTKLGKYVRFEWEKVKEWIDRQNAEQAGHIEVTPDNKNFFEGVGMHHKDLAAEKARRWRKSIQKAGIEPDTLGHYLGFTSDQMQGIWLGDIAITPEIEIRMQEIVSRVESGRVDYLRRNANKS